MSSQDTDCDGWTPRNDLADHARPSTCRTVGLIVAEDDEAISVAHTVDDAHGNVHGVMTIPHFAITAREALQPARRAQRWLKRS